MYIIFMHKLILMIYIMNKLFRDICHDVIGLNSELKAYFIKNVTFFIFFFFLNRIEF